MLKMKKTKLKNQSVTFVLASCSILVLVPLVGHAQEMAPTPSRLPIDRDNYIIPPQPSQVDQNFNEIPSKQNQTRASLLPEVTVEGSDKNDNRVGVHVPFIFDMTNSVGAGRNQSKLDLSVLSGLVTVNKDRQRNPISGEVTGPLTVTVFGIPVYTGRASGPASAELSRNQRNTAQARNEEIENLVDSRQAVISDGLRSASDQIQSTLTSTNEKVLSTLTSLVDRLSALMKRPLQDQRST